MLFVEKKKVIPKECNSINCLIKYVLWFTSDLVEYPVCLSFDILTLVCYSENQIVAFCTMWWWLSIQINSDFYNKLLPGIS